MFAKWINFKLMFTKMANLNKTFLALAQN